MEVDAYVFSTLVANAGTVSTSSITLSSDLGYNANGPIQALNDAFTALEEEEVPEEDQVVLASVSFINKLRSTNELVRTMDYKNEYKENVDFTVYEYMGRKLIAVPQRRFRTDIVLGANGFAWGAGSKNIDFIVCAKSAVYHVVKYDKIRVFQPKDVQDFDGYKVNVRVYHDCFIPDNKRVAIYAHVSEGTAKAPTISFTYNAELNELTSVAVVPGDLLIDGVYVASSAPAIGTALTDIVGEVAVAPYMDLATFELVAGDYYLFGARGGVVVAVNAVDKLTIPA